MSSSTNILTFLHRLLDSNIIGLVKYFCYSLKSLFLSRLPEPTRTVLEISSEILLKTPSKTLFETLSETDWRYSEHNIRKCKEKIELIMTTVKWSYL